MGQLCIISEIDYLILLGDVTDIPGMNDSDKDSIVIAEIDKENTAKINIVCHWTKQKKIVRLANNIKIRVLGSLNESTLKSTLILPTKYNK